MPHYHYYNHTVMPAVTQPPPPVAGCVAMAYYNTHLAVHATDLDSKCVRCIHHSWKNGVRHLAIVIHVRTGQITCDAQLYLS